MKNSELDIGPAYTAMIKIISLYQSIDPGTTSSHKPINLDQVPIGHAVIIHLPSTLSLWPD